MKRAYIAEADFHFSLDELIIFGRQTCFDLKLRHCTVIIIVFVDLCFVFEKQCMEKSQFVEQKNKGN